MISRGIHRQRCHKQARQLQDLGNRWRSMALEQANEKAQIYAVLEQITNLAQALEADGDGLALSFGEFRQSGYRYGGAPRIAALIQAVIRFINNWQRHKQAFQTLLAAQQSRLASVSAAESRS